MEGAITRAPAGTRHLLMCAPAYFDVVYEINPWMHVSNPADASAAVAEWEVLRAAYVRAGHEVDIVAPKHGLPDMVFAANGALVVDGIAYLARFRYPQRRGEERLYARWFRTHGFDVRLAEHTHEGEGDFVVMRDVILGGTGFRTSTDAHREAERIFDREVVTLELVDPRFYHLDTALFALDRDQIAYSPAASDSAARADARASLSRRDSRRRARCACLRLQRDERREQRVLARRRRHAHGRARRRAASHQCRSPCPNYGRPAAA